MTLPRLLVTRPRDRQEPFAARARALGVETILFPCVEIHAVDGTQLPSIPDLASFDAILFTSRSAVEIAESIRPFPWRGARAFAIGQATADALAHHGQAVEHAPIAPYTSEALLASWATRTQLDSALIIKGQGGRRLLEKELCKRGTSVTVLDVYRRARPAISASTRQKLLVDAAPDILSSTSDEILDNLIAVAGDALAPLQALPVIVNSERAAAHALDRGFHGDIRVARPAGDDGQLMTLQAWLQQR